MSRHSLLVGLGRVLEEDHRNSTPDNYDYTTFFFSWSHFFLFKQPPLNSSLEDKRFEDTKSSIFLSLYLSLIYFSFLLDKMYISTSS